ncbi:MAG: hypothetical protein Q4B13_09325 [Lautropia sp.]|nr:hypothetical protein [Lautropia sp.]
MAGTVAAAFPVLESGPAGMPGRRLMIAHGDCPTKDPWNLQPESCKRVHDLNSQDNPTGHRDNDLLLRIFCHRTTQTATQSAAFFLDVESAHSPRPGSATSTRKFTFWNNHFAAPAHSTPNFCRSAKWIELWG